MSLSPCRARRGFSAGSACSSFSGGHGRGGFSSRSLSPFRGCRGGSRGRAWGSGRRFGEGSGGTGLSLCPPGGIQEVTIDQSLLTPLKIEIDSQFQVVRTQEAREIRTLNNQFASFIDKVRFLEQQNKILETKWHLLQQLKVSDGPRGLEPVFENYLGHLRRQLEQLQRERGALDAELKAFRDQEEEYKAKYEEEALKHATVQNDFIILKKDVDGVFQSKLELEGKLESLKDYICFLKHLYAEELGQLQTQGSNTSVVVSIDNNRCLDFSDIIAEIRARYEEITQTSKAEAEDLFRTKYQELQASAQRNGDTMQETKVQISQLQQAIQRLQSQIASLKEQNASLQSAMGEAEQRGELALKDAQAKLGELEAALRMAKQDMARLLCEYQELTSTKLALDVEIATYRRLLEGEECWMSGECSGQVSISTAGGSAGVSGGVCGGPVGTCGLGGGQGGLGSSCSGIIGKGGLGSRCSGIVGQGGLGSRCSGIVGKGGLGSSCSGIVSKGGLGSSCSGIVGKGGLGSSCSGIVGKGGLGSGCSSIVTGGFGGTPCSGEGPALGSCSVSGSGFSSASSSSSSSGRHTILKKTVESSVKTSITY